MHLREALWRQKLKLVAARLPPISGSFQSSSAWKVQDRTLLRDLRRMPRMNADNVRRIVMRHAATMPSHGYIQGNLYLMYAIGCVFHDEASVFWAYTRVCHQTSCFGPDYMHVPAVVPEWLVTLAHGCVPIEKHIWDKLIRFRWLFIMFGQTFVHAPCLCAVWDYCLQDKHRMFCVCAALLGHASAQERPDKPCLLALASDMVAIQVDSVALTAELLATAKRLEHQTQP